MTATVLWRYTEVLHGVPALPRQSGRRKELIAAIEPHAVERKLKFTCSQAATHLLKLTPLLRYSRACAPFHQSHFIPSVFHGCFSQLLTNAIIEEKNAK